MGHEIMTKALPGTATEQQIVGEFQLLMEQLLGRDTALKHKFPLQVVRTKDGQGLSFSTREEAELYALDCVNEDCAVFFVGAKNNRDPGWIIAGSVRF